MISTQAFLHSALVTALLVFSQYVALRAGVFSVATAGLAAVGAYATAALTVRADWPVAYAAPVAIAFAAILATVLGVLISRLRGSYQAIATLAFVLVVQQVVILWEPVTGGTFGIFGSSQWAGVPALAVIVLLVAVGVGLVDHSRLGRQQESSRMDEQAAAACGVDVARVRLIAVLLSGALAGLSGVVIAGSQFSIDPNAFGFDLVVLTLAGAIIGGYRNASGPVVGAIVVAVPPIVLGGLASYQSVVTGLLTLLVLALAPRGLSSIRFRRPMSPATAPSSVARGSTPTVVAPLDSSSPRAGRPPLEVQGIARSFGGLKAVGGVSFELRRGDIVGLIGPNGAGKSTIVGLISGSLRLDRGGVTVGDDDLSTQPSFRVARAGVARTFQTVRLFIERSVAQNVALAALTCHAGGRAELRNRVSTLLAATGISHLANRSAGTLPYTDQRRVEIARALATDPDFLLLDEPAAGMTETEADELAVLVRSIASAGVGVLVIDHNVRWILDLCDHVLVQNSGVLIAEGAPSDVQVDPRVKAAYLG